MRGSISKKVVFGAGVILAAVVLAMGTTWFISMSTVQAIRASHELSEAVSSATSALESDTLAGGIKVLRYLETNDASHRQAYQQHSENIRRNINRLLELSRADQWKETVPVVVGRFQALDKLSLDIMARHDPASQNAEMRGSDVANMLAMQQEGIELINTRLKPRLKLLTNEADSKAAAGMMRVLLLAGGMSLLLALLAVFAARYVRLAIVTPIHQLAASADTVATGNFDHRVKLDADEEYVELAKNFNHMVAELQSTTVSRAKHEDQATQLRALLDGVRDYAIFSIDNDGYITSWNAASTRILGYQAKDMEGVSFARIFKDSNQARNARNEGFASIAANGRYETDTRLVNEKGEEFDANMVVTPLSQQDSQAKGYSVVVRDITERLKTERRIEHLATKDALTGLSNRSMLMEQLQAAIARATRARAQVVVMFIDLDKFKLVNDTLGHAAGDELLLECAKRLTECVREVDVVARLGGDEFVVLLTDVTDAAIVTPVAERMLKLLTTPYHLRGHDALTSASIGICFYPADGGDVTTLMKNADIAMYHAKELGRNNFQFYAEEMNQRMLHRAQLERELRAALENREFVLYYQPQVIVATGEIRGAESLIRWNHPTRGIVSPAEFIAVAEETGLIVPLGEWILDHACQTIKLWHENGIAIPYVVVNVSAAQLSNDLVKLVRNALVKHGIAANWLMLEITETMLMEQVEEAIAILRRIRELGIRIAMDDFGTGYSSLSVLQRLPLDTLKIDRSFVKAIDDETDNARAVAIIGAIIAIAKELSLSVVAEGVETPTQLAFLRTLNCDTYQGYLYSMPVDTTSMEARFAKPAKSVLEDEHGNALTLTSRVHLELSTDDINLTY